MRPAKAVTKVRRPRRGLYPELFHHALREHQRLPLRAGRQERFLDLFADNKQLDLLVNPNWQVIYGRRGTGKTTLLGALHETIQGKFDTDHNLCILVNVYDCLLTPVGADVSDRIKGTACFQAFVETLSNKLLDWYLNQGEQRGFGRLLQRFSSRKGAIEDSLLKVAILSQTGKPVGAYSAFSRRASATRQDGSTRELTARFGASASGPKVGLRLAAGGRLADTAAECFTETEEVEHAAVPRYALVRQELINLLDVMGVRTLHILIDEWPALDSTGLAEIQPVFAELLKRTFGGTNRFCVKAASTKYKARFNNRGAPDSYVGLEVGADIFEATNLDHIFMDEQELERFYQELLFTRLAYCDAGLRCFQDKDAGSGRNAPVAEFVLSIFDDYDAFRELVKGAGGIPRDFLELFNQLAHRHGYSVERLWTVPEVQRCLREVSVASKEDEIDYKSEADELRKRIMEVVAETNSRVVIFRRDDAGVHGRTLDELFEKRIVHHYPLSRMPAFLRPHYEAFAVDYGQYLDWKEAFGDDDWDEGRIVLSRVRNLDEALPLVVDAAGINGVHVTCRHCEGRFDKDARSYLAKRLCPLCFEEAA